MSTETAVLNDGTTTTIVERKYLTRTSGETVLYGAVTAAGRFLPAKSIRCITL